ncbi:hypothetical protein HDU87_001030 [Geranomyces variabilis]|uniref:precorrin-2 dehydrogenase n=1 Tax=Geranomyces variabilis TaxID=109894 RepID=A0AAD5TQ39_9FUNG|nr:hypothetical protein HDU87_001030 [Geranomyces variabilis]
MGVATLNAAPAVRGGASMVLTWNIAGRDVLVVGGNEAAAQRVLYALEADAHVTVATGKHEPISPSLQARIARGQVATISRHTVAEKDVEGKALVLVADSTQARHVSALCKQLRVPINIVDAIDGSDFWFMSTYRDHALQVAVSTGGNGPKIATKVRQQIASTVPASAGLAIENLAALRGHLRAIEPTDPARRIEFVTWMSEAWSLDALAALTQVDIEIIGQAYRDGADYAAAAPRTAAAATVQYVAAGSGDLDLLTRGAFNSIVYASVVVADAGVSDEILELVSGRLVVLDTRTTPSQVNDAVLASLQQKIDVVRIVAGTGLSSAVLKEIDYFRRIGNKVHVFPTAVALESEAAAPKSVVANVNGLSKHVNGTAHAISRAAPPPSRVGKSRSVNGIAAAAHIAYGLSDISFIYPVSTAGDAGKVMQTWADSGTTNAFGASHKVVTMSTRSGAASAVHGALSTGSSVTAVLSSEALTLMIPSMYEIARTRQPVVFHVAAQAVAAETFNLVPDISHVLGAAYTGFALLSSGSVQEAHDFALIAHVAAKAARAPVLHFFDGSRIAREQTVSKLVEYERLQGLAGTASVAAAGQNGDVVAAIDNAMGDLETTFGVRYKIFEYSGAPDAETVVVALGPAVTLAREAAKKIGGKTGALNIRLLRPWSARHFIAALPRTVKKMVVIEQSNTGNGHGPLFLDVSACFYTKSWTGRTPVILRGQFATDSLSFHPAAVEALFRNAAAPQPEHDFIMRAKHVDTASDTPYRRDRVHEAILWDLQESGTGDAAEDLVGFIAQDRPVESYTAREDAQIDPVSATHLRYADDGSEAAISSSSSAPHFIHSADYAGVHDLALLQRYNVAESIRHGGILVLNTHLAADDLAKEIPESVKAEVMSRNLKVKTIDADGIARDWTLFKGRTSEYVKLILTAVFLRLAPKIDFVRAMKELGGEIARTEADRSILATKLGAVQRALTSIRDVTISHAAPTADAERLPRVVGNGVHNAKVALKEEEEEDATSRVTQPHEGIWPVLFPEAYCTRTALRPDVEGAYQVKITENRRLTPEDYDRNVFHLEMDISGTGLKYEIGEALGVHGHNDPEAVLQFLGEYGLDPNHVVYVDRRDPATGKQTSELRTVAQMFTQVVDVFGKPGRKFYQSLQPFLRGVDPVQHAELHDLLSDAEAMQRYVDDETPTYADLLLRFSSAKPTVEELLNLIPPIKPRHYSISSAQSMHPDSVHLLVVLVDWKTKTGASRYGQCTRYLLNAKLGQTITVTIKPSVMKLPKSHTAPVIMSGLGTGMAPFRAFIQERAYWKAQGHPVGPMTLYFGSRYRAMEYLYGEEMEAYHADGVLTHLRLAFSRDQKEKVYIQHKIAEDGVLLKGWMVDPPKEEEGESQLRVVADGGGGAFYLCGPTWPVPDVRDALVDAFSADGGMTTEAAAKLLEALKETERYILEVY